MKLNGSQAIVLDSKPIRIEVLIGSDHHWDLVTGNVKRRSKVRAVEILVGWTADGEVQVVVTPVM